MDRLLILAILIISTLPVYAQGQQPNAAKLKADAQKVVTIISSDTGRRDLKSLQRFVLQSNGIALAFHRHAQYRARQLVRFHGFIADELEGQPRFVESCL